MKSIQGKAPSAGGEVECVADLARAAVLLRPVRLEIVRRARRPKSATELAEELDLPRQRINYHVQELAKAGFLKRSGTRRKRNLLEQLFAATAEAYLLAPEVLGPAAPDWRCLDDAASASTLLALSSKVQSEVAIASREAAAQGRTLSTLSLHSAVRFVSAAQRAAFTEALSAAVAEVVERCSAPYRGPDGEGGEGRPYRLVLTCHPVPPEGGRFSGADFFPGDPMSQDPPKDPPSSPEEKSPSSKPWSDLRELRTTATPEQVWRAWADPEIIAQWFADRAEGSAEPGGELIHHFPQFGFAHRYRVLESDPARRLLLEVDFGGRLVQQEILVSVEGGETVLELVHSGFGSEDGWGGEYEGIDSGWKLAFSLLRHYLENYFGRPRTSYYFMLPAAFRWGEPPSVFSGGRKAGAVADRLGWSGRGWKRAGSRRLLSPGPGGPGSGERPGPRLERPGSLPFLARDRRDPRDQGLRGRPRAADDRLESV